MTTLVAIPTTENTTPSQWNVYDPIRRKSVADIATGAASPEYTHWRHGGYYTNVVYPSGACGCVARFKGGKEWGIACDLRSPSPVFRHRDEAARAEAALVLELWDALRSEGSA